MRFNSICVLLLVLTLMVLVACSDGSAPAATGTPKPVVATTVMDGLQPIDDQVSLHQSSVSWETYQYELNAANHIVPGSFDGETKVRQSYTSWVLENKFLTVTLVPEMGGRILSIIYKPTGHEALYQNPVGVPYQIDTGIFYYDWLMVYGGIFPTFPEPEHGKTWLLPWDFTVVKESDQEVVVAMSIQDDIDDPTAPGQYDLGPTGLEVTYTVSLRAGRAAVDTTVTLSNPGENEVTYEYWTNTTLAPGSDPGDPKTTAGAEIIAPIDMIKIPNYWRGIAAQEDQTGFIDVYTFANLRRFVDWPDMGIAYAFPDMREQNFWGVINHDNDEGIFRIADNTLTPGLKIWTWGYPQSTAVDPQAGAVEVRPYIELWAGVTREFWQRTELAANGQLEIWEVYGPSVGLTNVTHANNNFLVNLAPVDSTTVECRLFSFYPEQTVTLALSVDGADFYENTVTLDAEKGNDCTAEIPATVSGETLTLVIRGADGTVLFDGIAALAGDS